MLKGKIAILAVFLMAVAFTEITPTASHSFEERVDQPQNVDVQGSGPKHFNLELTEAVNIKSNP